jgi:replication factor C small subunit
MIKKMWVEKYRPKSISNYVFKDDRQKKQIMQWISEGSFPHLILSGGPGVGKTTLSRVLFNELDIDPADVLEINASRTNGVDDVRDRIVGFVQTIPFGDFKVVFLDEADYLSLNAQAALRGVMEEYHETARFVLTCNTPRKIMPAIHSRCQGFHVEKLDKIEFTARVAQILIDENIKFDLDTLDSFVKLEYPDLRKCIQTVQESSFDGALEAPSADSENSNWKFTMVDLFKRGKISEARKLICNSILPDEIEEMFRWLYTNIDLFGADEYKQDDAILIIKQGLVDHAIVADPEINLAAVLIQLSRI